MFSSVETSSLTGKTEPFAGWGPITRRSASTVCTNWEYQWTSMSIVNIWTGSIRPFCNVLFVKTNDKYWLRARSRIRDTHRVSTVLVNYIGTTVSPALFIVRHRRKLLNEQLVAAASSRFASRCAVATTTIRPSLFPPFSSLRLEREPDNVSRSRRCINCWKIVDILSLSFSIRAKYFFFSIAFHRSS